MSKKKKDAKDTNEPYTPLSGHQRNRALLTPPLASLPITFASWVERLPDTLWASLLIAGIGRERALGRFRRVLGKARHLTREGIPPLVTHSGLSAATPSERRVILDEICAGPAAAALRPLRLLPRLPDRVDWCRNLDVGVDPDADWLALKRAVAVTFDHQSEAATDCRWLRVMSHMAREKLKFGPDHAHIVEELNGYPDVGDLRRVRPTVRSMEGGLSGMDTNSSPWSGEFWNDCMALVACDFAPTDPPHGAPRIGTTVAKLEETRSRVLAHMSATRTTTGLDARHDAAFGLSLYALGLLEDLLRVGAGTQLVARMALRSLVESAITLAYLAKRNSPDVWRAYRAYGAGQAKLALLKFIDHERPPSFVDRGTLETLANEDMYLEYVSIDLGHWDKLDTRRMSEQADAKDLYDGFYQWPSGFIHGHWTAVRDAVMQTCWNPLHRLHRVGRSNVRSLSDVVPDACIIVDRILETLDGLYPRVGARLLDDAAASRTLDP